MPIRNARVQPARMLMPHVSRAHSTEDIVTPEGAILKSILDYLAAKRILAFRMQVGSMPWSDGKRKRFLPFGTQGMADILAFPDGHVLWVEVKAAKGKQSEFQKSFQAQVEEHGHRYILARSIEDVEEALKR
jgi:hypothetical protein